MRESNTYSRHWDLETRQHELLGIDLGEGVRRTTLRYGALFIGTWWTGWLVLFGVPSPQTVPLFLIPPITLTHLGSKRSLTYWRRTNLLVWSVHVHYLVRGVRPVIGRGRIPTRRLGVRLRARRLGERMTHLPRFPGIGPLFAATGEDPARSAGPPVRVRHRARLYGPDAVARSRRRLRKRRRPAPEEK